MIDHTLNFMKERGEPCTVDNYCLWNFGMLWEDVQRGEYPEWEADVLSLVENGLLQVPTKTDECVN